MMSLEQFKINAGTFGLPLDFVIKESFLFDLLSQTTALQGSRLIFKGGTAINKIYLKDLQRFSEDLDFDTDAADYSELEKLAKELAANIKNFRIREFRRVKNTIQFYCEYDSPVGRLDHVRIDLALKKIITAEEPVRATAFSSFYNATAYGITTYALDDLVARKLNALADRCEGKDVYDVSNTISKTKNLEGAIEKMLASENSRLTAKEFLQKAIKKLETVNAKKIKNLANP